MSKYLIICLFSLIIIDTNLACPPSPLNPALRQYEHEGHHEGEGGGGSTGRSLSMYSRSLNQQMDTDRENLLKDAISWLTLRQNGKLLSDIVLQPLFDYVREKYLQSKFYKTFVIAFENGVYPKLTLNMGDPCDLNYIWAYRDPYNYSVTYFYQKEFIFNDFNKVTTFPAYCDYRQGLVCSPKSSKCKCPPGAKMEVVDPANPTVKRCLLQENKICALIDLGHSSKYDALLEHLPFMIFNLEKPPGCKPGTQCRFKDKSSPKCYSNTAAFTTYQGDESFGMVYGHECTLNLIAEPGMCEEKQGHRKERGPNGYVCYNYWGKEGYANKTGFCANEFGPFGEIPDNPYPVFKAHHPFLAYFVNPKTTGLRGEALVDYRNKLLQAYSNYFQSNSLLQWKTNGPCSVTKTEKMLEIYRFYKGLIAGDGGNRPVPDGGAIQKTMEEVVALTHVNQFGDRLCNIIWRFEYDGEEMVNSMPMTCVKKGGGGGASGGKGNDGQCKDTSPNLEGQDENKFINDNLDRLLKIEVEMKNEEKDFDQSILDRFPETIKPPPPPPPKPEPPVVVKPIGPSEPEEVNDTLSPEVLQRIAEGGALPGAGVSIIFVIFTQILIQFVIELL